VDRPPATLLAREAWQLGFDAIRTMPRLFGGTFLVLLVFGTLFRWQHPPEKELSLASALLGYASDIATEVIIVGAMIAVYRYALLREVRDRPVWDLPPNYDRVLAWTLLLNLPMLPGIAMIGLANAPGAASAVLVLPAVVALGVAVVILVRLTAFLAILAADAPGAEWRKVWAMSRGHVWRFIVVGLLTFLPLYVAGYAASKLIEGVGGPGAFLAETALGAAQALLLGAIGAAMWSRLVQVYGAVLLRPAGPW